MSRDVKDYIPREPREACTIETTLVDENGRELFARLGNISQSGFMAECEEKLRMEAQVAIELPDRGRVDAEVRWVLGWKFGAKILTD
ncbi:MAG: hypothetical protein CVT74_13095 [Alphaproteobacteria bacterium HGW-Alphaproteobacteria-13]|nr:MAG: hypothetical protein CVT74_13095 [Alphaproteobacteria bacterium HGW-Alphaproteobacteria-13]